MSPEGINCPICLYPPVAAKITRCGHIYCWACVLHFLSLTDNAWQKCPICFESIYQKDLKRYVLYKIANLAFIEYILMTREIVILIVKLVNEYVKSRKLFIYLNVFLSY